MDSYSCIIIDDNYVDGLLIKALVKRYAFLDFKGLFDNPADALEYMNKNPVQILFSDVEMPGINGLALRRKAMEVPACVFITSYPEYAVDSFELSALDYLIKPVDNERFARAMQRLESYMELRCKADLFDYAIGGDTIFVKDGTKQIKIKLHEIQYLEALKDYTRINTPGKNYCVLGTLQAMLNKAEFKSFLRIHRSYAVHPHKITGIDMRQVHLNDIKLPVGRSYKAVVDALLMG
jgi:DNA-binding LytR/AlgR family response regulator